MKKEGVTKKRGIRALRIFGSGVTNGCGRRKECCKGIRDTKELPGWERRKTSTSWGQGVAQRGSTSASIPLQVKDRIKAALRAKSERALKKSVVERSRWRLLLHNQTQRTPTDAAVRISLKRQGDYRRRGSSPGKPQKELKQTPLSHVLGQP